MQVLERIVFILDYEYSADQVLEIIVFILDYEYSADDFTMDFKIQA